MQRLIGLFCFVIYCVSHVHMQMLYECNFGTVLPGNNCFNEVITIGSSVGAVFTTAPNSPSSDVTSITMPTDNGEVCNIPYRIGTNTWDMNFCNRGYCPTQNSPNSTCAPGLFGSVQLNNNNLRSFTLKTESGGGISGSNEQCLVYYYYMANLTNVQSSITVLREESNAVSDVIDSVTRSSLNGWVQRRVDFQSAAPGYKIHFNIQRMSGFLLPYIGLDEISIKNGRCNDEPVTHDSTTTTPVVLTTSISTPVIELTTTTIGMVSTMSTSTIPVPSDTTTTTVVGEVTTVEKSTTTVASSTSTPIEAISSTTTTPLTSSTTTKEATTQEEMISSTTTLISSSTTTSFIPPQTTTTSTTTPPQMSTTTSVLPETSTSTTPVAELSSTTTLPSQTTTTTVAPGTSTLSTRTTTTAANENVIISVYTKNLPRKTSHTVAMATVIPIVWLAFLGILVWIKRGALNRFRGISQPLDNTSVPQGSTPSSFELRDMDESTA